MKGKEEKKRYIHLSAEFQKIARRDKKAFVSDQCKEKEEKERYPFECRVPKNSKER